MTREELAAFDDEVLLSVGTEVGAERLAALAREHQAGVRDLPGVDDIVYEWRRGLPWDPLLFRSPEVYVLAVPNRVWAEFLDRLSPEDPEAEALRELHDRQARRTLERVARQEVTDALDARAAMVLTRP
ncbi:MAG: hypothetical protein V5A30_04600 [Haloarculaceae archaeon]